MKESMKILLILVIFTMIAGCGKVKPSKFIIGKWQQTGFDCDSSGDSCKTSFSLNDKKKIIFLFDREGMCVLKNIKAGKKEIKSEYKVYRKKIYFVKDGNIDVSKILHISENKLILQTERKTSDAAEVGKTIKWERIAEQNK